MAKIEIDLADLGLGGHYDEDGEFIEGKNLQDLIVNAAVSKLINSNRNLEREVKEQVSTAITDEIDSNVKALVAEAFSAPVQRTTAWGEKQGEETTVRELIRKSLETYLKAPASNRGYGDKPKNLTELIDDSTKQILDKDFNEYLKQVKEGVKVSVHQKALDAAVAYLQK